jgi:L-iditol 2-dehydrogenase
MMQALVKYGYEDRQIEVRDVPAPPEINDDQVLLRVETVGVCGSDIHLWHNNQSWDIKLPLILGHEWCGTVAEAGKNTGFKSGERVVVETAAEVCGQCIYCMTGNYNLCPHRKGYGNLYDGSMTDYVIARPQILHRVPANVPSEWAALTEPICVAYNALVETTFIQPGDMTVIQGPGPIGIMAQFVAQIRGASPIIMLGTNADRQRLQVASELGADYVINIQEEDPVELVRSLGDGFGADLVVDCTGVSRALKQSMDMVRPRGRIAKIGWGPEPLDFSLDPLVGKAVTLQGSFSHTFKTWERVLQLLSSGQIDLTKVIGGVYGLHDWEQAFTLMEDGLNVKSVLKMN